MHFPVNLSLPHFTLSLHLIMESFAFILGYRYYLYLRERTVDTISSDRRQTIFIFAAGGAFLFSRIIGALENPTNFFQSPHPLLYLFSAKTIVGGLLGGLLCVEIGKKYIGEKYSSGDLMTFPLIFGMILGRIGCFSMGVFEPTFGYPSYCWTAMDLGDGIPRHPLALYEIVFLISLWILLNFINKRKLQDGLLFKMFMISYLIYRISIDFIKPRTIIAFNLSTIQFTCILGMLYYTPIIFKYISNPKRIFVINEPESN
jgi:phosphatidylglycerol---prolipoprotein diacylglyceryl transferase